MPASPDVPQPTLPASVVPQAPSPAARRRAACHRAVARVRRGANLWMVLVLGCAACSRCEDAPEDGQGATMDSPFDPERPADPLAPPTERFPLGAWASTEDYRMRVVALEKCEVEPYFAPRPGHQKIGVLLEFAGRRDEPVPVNGLFATLLDASGSLYRPTPAGCRPSLPAGRVDAGQSLRGFVSFEVPDDAGGLVLRYEPVLVGRAPLALSFDLGR